MPANRIKVTFSTNAGDLVEEFPANQPLHALKREVMGRLKLDPSQADQFVVSFNGQLLDENKTLAELAIPSGAILVIERREVVKI